MKTDNNFLLPLPMRIARRAKVHKPDRKAWWYISPDNIGVYIENGDGKVSSCELSRKQLERALEVMKSCE